MTTLLGFQDPSEGSVYLAADRRVCSGNLIVSDVYRKIVRAGRWTFAVSGTTAAVDCLNRAVELQSEPNVYSLMVRLREIFVAEGWQFDHADGGKGSSDFSMVMTDGARLWLGFSAFSVAEIPRGELVSGGSGGELGQGAAEALIGRGGIHSDNLREAVRIAVRHDSASGGEPEVWRCWPGGAEEVP